MTPYPKPEKREKKKQTGIKRVSNKDVYFCSDQSKVSQAYIDRKVSESYAKGPRTAKCEAYPELQANDHSHIVSRTKLKDLHLTDFIWDSRYYTFESRQAHNEWEHCARCIEDHANVVYKMCLLFKHDLVGFWRRYDKFSNFKVMQEIKSNLGI